MSGKTIAQKANALITHYVKLYKERYGSEPNNFNRHALKWGFQDMITDLGETQAYQVVEYYFRTGRVGHPVQYLLFNYEKLAKIHRDVLEDQALRVQLRQETKSRVEGWKFANE